jgi:acetylglutamate kinase
MIPKLRAGVRACEAGTRCHIVDGREAHALRAVLDGAMAGTRVTV